MATYKVIQDIEAEDTLVGPLTLRQCIYAAVAAVSLYLCFIAITKHAAFLVLFLLPFAAFGIFFAFPWSKQQPTEVWALAKVRFYFKPRKRIWNQSGIKELVTITVPKTIKHSLASELTPMEVSSRLKALADTIDSRGWAIKNVDLGYYTKSSLLPQATGSDRLIDSSTMPQDVPNYDISATTDIFDTENSSVAQKLDQMMQQSATNHRQQLVTQLAQQPAVSIPQQPVSGPLQPTMPVFQSQPSAGHTEQPLAPSTASAPVSQYWHMRNVTPLPDAELADSPSAKAATALASAQFLYPSAPQAAIPIEPTDYTNLRTSSARPASIPANSSAGLAQPAVTAPPKPAILDLANNNDLNVATIAREAQARSVDPPDEVVVSLH